MFFVLLLYALFASVFTVSKTGLQYASPLFFVGTRMVFAGVLLLLYLFLIKRRSLSFRKGQLWRLFLLASFNIYLTNIFEFWGLQHLTSSKACFIYSLSPFIAALFSYFLLSEMMSPKKWMGLIIGFLGFIPIFLSDSTSEQGLKSFLFFSWPELCVMIAAAASVYGWILLKQLVSEDGFSPLEANGVSMFFGGGMALLHSYFTESWTPVPVKEMAPFLKCAAALVLISNLICYNLYGYLLRRFTATFVSFAGFTTPLFTAILGWFFLGETVTMSFYLSTIVVFSGLYLFYQDELQKGVVAGKASPEEIPSAN